jgi:hypothetical protein
VIAHDGRHHVFFEDACRATGVGRISVMSDDGLGRFGTPQCVLERPYHLSYPFVFHWAGNWYLLPETSQNRTLEVYRAVRFPESWEPANVLMHGLEAYDATLWEHLGRWWLFANVRERPGTSTWDELHIFHADNPLSREWQAHPANPVVSDVTRARPAGRIYVEDGHLYRPSQDSSRRYGRAVMINEIVALSETRYEERTVLAIEPGRFKALKAIHSFSRAGRMTLIDAIRREPRLGSSRDRFRTAGAR